MDQNIKLIIGNNAIGKTRYLNRIAQRCIDDGLEIVTNLDAYVRDYQIDKDKIELLGDGRNRRFDEIMLEHKVSGRYDAYLRGMMELICSKGDVLLLDEIDINLLGQDVVWICIMLADVRSLYKEIVVTSYSYLTMRMFTDIDYETDKETFNPNVYVIDGQEAVRLTEEQIYEYFDTI